MQEPTVDPTGLKTNGYDLLGGTQTKNTPLIATLYGVRKSLAANLGLSTVRLVTHDNQKRILSTEAKSKYPYGYMRIRSLRIIKDRTNVQAIRRHGAVSSVKLGQEITIDKGYLFPASLAMELTFVSDDIFDVLHLTEKLAIISAYNGFTFGLTLPELENEFFVAVKFESDDFSIPDSVLQDEQNPASMELTFPFTVETHLGIVKQVAKINNQGQVDHSIGVPGQESA